MDKSWKDMTAEEREAIRLERQRDSGGAECSECGVEDYEDSFTRADGRLWCEECFQAHMGTGSEVEELAARFSELLRETLTKEQMAQVILRNADEKSAGVCHSHDFCDANMVMFAAGTKYGFWGEEADVMEHNALWNAAWDLAKKRGFTFGGER